jgi:hypothetical protein
MLAIFTVRNAPKADGQRCVSNLPADSLDRMSQVRSAAAEIEIGQTDHPYAGLFRRTMFEDDTAASVSTQPSSPCFSSSWSNILATASSNGPLPAMQRTGFAPHSGGKSQDGD